MFESIGARNENCCEADCTFDCDKQRLDFPVEFLKTMFKILLDNIDIRYEVFFFL